MAIPPSLVIKKKSNAFPKARPFNNYPRSPFKQSHRLSNHVLDIMSRRPDSREKLLNEQLVCHPVLPARGLLSTRQQNHLRWSPHSRPLLPDDMGFCSLSSFLIAAGLCRLCSLSFVFLGRPRLSGTKLFVGRLSCHFSLLRSGGIIRNPSGGFSGYCAWTVYSTAFLGY